MGPIPLSTDYRGIHPLLALNPTLCDPDEVETADLYETVKARIASALEAAGSNPKRASLRIKERHGTSETLIRDILSGRTKNPQLSTLALIAEEVGRPVPYLVGGEAELAPRKLAIPSEKILAEVLAGLLPIYFPGGQVDEGRLLKFAAVLRDTLAQYAENPAGYDELPNSQTPADEWSNLSLRRSA